MLASSASVSRAASPAITSGSIAGFVRDAAGVPQMGASVMLFNRYERLIQRTISNERGLFGFESLTPDLYSVRVSLASFVPAMKQKIAVQPGVQSLLYVDLASVLSSIELVYAPPGQSALMSDDWKWALKASASTRPVLRFLPDQSSDPSDKPAGESVFGVRPRHFAVWAQPSSTQWQCRLQRRRRAAGRRIPHQFQPRWIWAGSGCHHAAGLSARPLRTLCSAGTARRCAGHPNTLGRHAR